MKHVGHVLKEHIEKTGIKKGDVAAAAGISYNYLSTIFNKPTIDALLLEKLFVAAGLNPAVVFDSAGSCYKNYSEISSTAVLGTSTITIGEAESLRMLIDEKDKRLEEKERTIKILMAQRGLPAPEQNGNNNI